MNPGSPVLAATAVVVRRTALAMLGLMLASITVYLSVFDAAFASAGWAWLTLAMVWSGWIAWLLRWISGPSLVVWSTLATVVTMLTLTTTGEPGAYTPVTMWAAYPGLAASFVLSDATRRRGALTCVVVVGLGLLGGHVFLAGPPLPQSIIMVTTAAAFAMAGATAVTILRATARADDAVAQASARASARAAAVAAASDEAFRLGRILHDGIINTLGAMSRGVPATSVNVLRRRCASDVAVTRAAWSGDLVRSAAPAGVCVTSLLADLEQAAAARGIELSVTGAGQSARLPDDVSQAVTGAMVECLTNTAKHSAAHRAVIDVTANPTGLVFDYRELGVGGPLAFGWPGNGGIAQSIGERSRRAGVSSEVVGTRHGVRVTLTWQYAAHPLVGADGPVVLHDQLLPMANAVAGWLLLLCAVEMVVNWSRAPAQWWLFAALAVTTVVGVTLAVARHRTPVIWPVSALLVVASGGLQLLPLVRGARCTAFDFGLWGTQGAAVALMLLTLLAGSGWWIVAGFVASRLCAVFLLSTINAGDGCDVDWQLGVFTGGFATSLALCVYRVWVKRLSAQTQQRLAALQVQEEALAGKELRARVRRRTWEANVGSQITLLADVAAGRADPLDPQVQADAGRRERFLRNVAQLDAAEKPLHAVIEDFCRTAFAADLDVQLTLGDSGSVTWPQVNCVRLACDAVLAQAASPVHVTVTRPDDVTRVMMSFTPSPQAPFAWRHTVPPGCQVAIDSDAHDTFLEISLAAGPADPAARCGPGPGPADSDSGLGLGSADPDPDPDPGLDPVVGPESGSREAVRPRSRELPR